MPGWLVKVVKKRDGGLKLGHPIAETYIVNIADRMAAWAAVAALANKTDPRATAEVIGAASDQELAAGKLLTGEVRRTDRVP